jgi:hypothetical protein
MVCATDWMCVPGSCTNLYKQATFVGASCDNLHVNGGLDPDPDPKGSGSRSAKIRNFLATTGCGFIVQNPGRRGEWLSL